MIIRLMRYMFLVMLMLLACVEPAIRADVLTVGKMPADFSSIQKAVNAARAGDTIQIQPGTYHEQIVLDRQLTLAGTGKPLVRGTGKGSVIEVQADGCVITGLRIENSGGDLTREDSGILIRSQGNQISDNELRDILFGIYLYHSHHNTIRNNVIAGRQNLETGSRGAGLHIWNSAENIVEDNSITETRDGMYFQYAPGNRVHRNRVFKVRYGLHYMYADDNEFTDNSFTGNVAGAAMMYSKGIRFRRNAFAHNRGFSSFGILFQDCEGIEAENNYIIDNAVGIFMEAVRDSRFHHNVIAENDLALHIFSSSDRNLFTQNNFIENLSPLHLIGRQSTTRWQENGQGNFWSDYDGYDLNEDGIGDVPHKVQNVFEYLEGNFPRLRLFLSSAAAQSLATAEKTFPVIKGSEETDAAPLMKAVVCETLSTSLAPTRGLRISALFTSFLMCGVGVTLMWQSVRRRVAR